MENGPELNFETLPIDSIAISGHKFVGCPMPAGISSHVKNTFKNP